MGQRWGSRANRLPLFYFFTDRKGIEMKRLALILLIVFLAGPSFAQEINVCTSKRTGVMRMVNGPTQCNKKTERHIVLNQGGGSGVTGIKVYDAEGQSLGILHQMRSDESYEGAAATSVFVPGINLFVIFDGAGNPDEWMGGLLLYSYPNCKGQAFASDFGNYWNNHVMNNGKGRFYGFDRTTLAKREVKSSYFDGVCENSDSPEVVDSYAVQEVTLPFSFPVSMPLRFSE